MMGRPTLKSVGTENNQQERNEMVDSNRNDSKRGAPNPAKAAALALICLLWLVPGALFGDEPLKPPAPEEVKFDPTPVESPSGPAVGTEAAEGEAHPRQVKKLRWRERPFEKLHRPEQKQLPKEDPRSDTLRLGPEPPPEPGEVLEPFPSKMKAVPPPKVAVAPLKVVRHSPDKEIDMVERITVSFSQPMVPLAALPEIDATSPPFTVEPMPEGRFLWLGTDTVAFEAKKRLPYATTYRVSVPAGIKSALGQALAEPLSWSFETPRPTVTSFSPYNQQTGLPLEFDIHVYFNTLVDPTVILKWIEMTDDKGRKIKLAPKLPMPAKEGAPPPPLTGHAAFSFEKGKLRPGTKYKVRVKDGLLSAEGPLWSTQGQEFTFSTYDPLKITQISCYWGEDECYPGQPINVQFNNPLAEQDLEKLIRITPKPEGLKVEHNWSSVGLQGAFMPSTSYTVKVAKGFKDIHGQTSRKGAVKKLRFHSLPPFLKFAAEDHMVMEAAQGYDFEVVAMNMGKARLRLAPVPAEMAPEAASRGGRYFENDEDPMEGLKPVLRKTIALTKKRNRVQLSSFSLKKALNKEGYGFVFLELKPLARPKGNDDDDYDAGFRTAFIQVTDLGLSVAESGDEAVVRVASLETGMPVPGTTVTLKDRDWRTVSKGTTDNAGVVRLTGPAVNRGAGSSYYLLAEKGGDKSFQYYYEHTSYRPETNPGLGPEPRAFIFTERGVYRPNEEVHVTVIARLKTRGPDGDLVPLGPEQRKFNYNVQDPRGGKLGAGELLLSPFGIGSFTVKTAKDAPLGYYSMGIKNDHFGFSGNFQVEEYRTPEFRVDAEWLHGGSNVLIWRKLEALVTAAYYFGAPMSGATVNWTLTRTSSFYNPPGNPGFNFQDRAQARFWHYHFHHHRFWGPRYDTVSSGSSTADADGKLAIPLVLDPGGMGLGPVSFTIEANVIDENRQAVAGRAFIVAHRAERYVGISVDRAVVEKGETINVSAVVTRLDGTRYDKAEATVRLVRAFNAEDDGRYTEKEVGRCTISSGKVPGSCRLTVPEAGVYLVRAETLDLADRPVTSAIQVQAYGQGECHWKPDPENRVSFVQDKQEYEPGDTATLLVQAPFKDAVGLATVSREGFLKVVPLDVENGIGSFKFPIEEKWIPGVQVGVLLARGRTELPGKTPDDPGRPSFAQGYTSVKISSEKREIFMKLERSSPAVAPGGTFTLGVAAADSEGRPVASNLAVMVVDEGVLSLIAYKTPEPLRALYRVVSGGIRLRDLRSMVMPRFKPEVDLEAAGAGPTEFAQPQMLMDSAMRLSMGKPKMAEKKASKSAKGGADDSGFALREIFKSTAYFNSQLRTGKDGKLSVDIKMPDNTTEFRVMVIAMDDAKLFGSAETKVQTRKTLIVRPSLPRFLNYGDKFEAAVVINNQTGFDTEVLVRCAAANAVVEEEETQIPVKAGEAKEVRFKARAGNPGPATFQFAAVALTKNRDRDAAQITIPTLIPATSEAFATYGVVEEAVRQPLVPPEDVLAEFGGLDVSMSSTALTGLQDATSYLFEYPHECTEQVCSRILPILALGDILKDFDIGGPTTVDEAKRLVERGVKKILRRQRDDGGFGYWSGSNTSWLYLSAYATMTLEWAKRKEFEVPDYPLRRAADFLQYRLDHPHDWEKHAYGAQTMAALVLTRMDRTPWKHLDRLYEVATTKKPGARPGIDYPMTIYATAWLMEALGLADEKKNQARVAQLYRVVENAGVETASAMHFAEGKSEYLRLMMHTAERTDAIVLGALLAVRKDSPLIEKTVRGLIRSRIKGRWSTTQANVYALLALSEYYRIFESDEPDFEARLWLEDKFLTGREFRGRDMAIAKTRVPMKALLEEAAGDLILAKDGPGRLYYRLGLKYAPSDLDLEAEDRGFTVDRIYVPIGEESVLEKREDGTWIAGAGSYIAVRVRVIAPDRRYFVAVVDPMPAGVDAVNERFVTSSQKATGQAPWQRWWWWNPWDHMEKRDDRLQVFADRMWGGVYEYTYVTRATTIGTFVVPPARAEEMYNPETFGRSGTDTFVVVP